MSPQNRSFWLTNQLPSGFRSCPPLAGETRADVVIIGGGFAGLWTSLVLKEKNPSLDVVILERDVCGGGASGRNAGYVLNWWARFPALEAVCGADEAVALGREAVRAVDEIESFCRDNGVSSFRRDGWLWAATCKAHVGSWSTAASSLARSNFHPFEELSGREIAGNWGLDGFVAGVIDRSCASVDPAELAFALRRVALEKGVRIFEDTPMTRFARQGPVDVETPRGRLRAERLVLAINAWFGGMPEFRSSILIAASELAVTQPVPEKISGMGWTGGPYVNDARLMVGALRALPDGRVMFGKGGGRIGFAGRVGNRFEGAAPRLDLMTNEFHRYSSHFEGLSAETSWIGAVDRTRDGLPMFGYLGGNRHIVFGGGFSGNGVGPTRLGARIMASLLLENGDALARTGIVRAPIGGFPPEPFRQLGGRLVMNAVHRRDVALHTGTPVGALTERIARLAPSTLVSSTRTKGNRRDDRKA
jgi:glycine/D-amino acid oxidase-like deaminating enzyme